MSIQRFKFEKIAQEKLVLTFDFSNGLATGETLTGTPTVLVSVARGKDLIPNSLLNGIAQFDATTKMVLQPVKDGVKGAEYLIRVIAPTTNAAKTLAMEAILPVI